MKREIKETKLEVYGRVQGVNFRNNVKEFCDGKGISGFTMNRNDGSVLIVAQADEEKLNELISWVKSSPALSKVNNVNMQKYKAKSKHKEFKIIREGSFIADQRKSFSNLFKNLFPSGVSPKNLKICLSDSFL